MNGFLLTETPVLDKAFLSYRRTAEYVPAAPASVVDPVEEHVTATAGYAARFDGLTGDTLRRVEETQDTDAANDRIGGPLPVLDAWRAAISAGRSASAREYEAALNAVREAWLRHSFRWEGGLSLPYPFDRPVRSAS